MASVASDNVDPAAWSEEASVVARKLGSSPDGLSSKEAGARLRIYGPNALEDSDRSAPLKLLWRQFESPLVLILVFGATVAFLLQDWTEASIILAIVLGSTALGFAQEFHASRAVDALRQRMALKSRVLRDGGVCEIAASEIVPGDVVLLSAGNLVPADGRILEAQDFLVSEASLTGEPFPVEKRPGNVESSAPLAARSNFAFAGSSVRSGSARVLITTTGISTAFGAVAARLREREPETAFVRGLRRFGNLLLRVTVLLVLFVLTLNQMLGRPFLESLLFSVALAVGMSPELLPAIVSVTLSAGARAMAKEGVLVRRLDAIENLGGVDLVCTDKTGTLTEGAVALKEALDPNGVASEHVLALAYVNATFETGIENPLDQAIKAGCEARNQSVTGWSKLDEIPYDFQRKRLTIVAEKDGEPPMIISKGAFNEIVSVCTEIETTDGKTPLTEAQRTALSECYRTFGTTGLRALAIATRSCSKQADYTKEDERDMRFVGFLTFVDPVKRDARAAIDAMKAAGVSIKVITGDNRYVATHVASELGLDCDAIATGEAINAAKGGALIPLVERTQLFAEVDPQQKERIVKALQHNGHVVGFIGDGVTDAPSLYAADVGISVDRAVDVAREAADVILLKPDLGVLKRGIESGRRAFANTMKYICITTGSSFGNMVSMALATPFLPFLPLTATQVLLTNFMSDLPLTAVSTDNVDSESVARPLRWSVRDIQSFMLIFGLLSSVFDIITFTVLRGVFHAQAIEFQSSWFVVSVLTEIVALVVLRTARPSWRSLPGRWLMILGGIVAIVVVILPYASVAARPLGLFALPASLLAACVVITLAYAGATEIAKAWRGRHNSRQGLLAEVA